MNQILNSSSDEVVDKFQKRLQEALETLKQCQTKKNLDSCLKCQEVLECPIRDSYIVAVYESMNRGQGGGFEF